MAMIDLSQWQDMPDEHLMVWWFSISRVDLAWSYTLVIYCRTSPSKPSSVTSWWITALTFHHGKSPQPKHHPPSASIRHISPQCWHKSSTLRLASRCDKTARVSTSGCSTVWDPNLIWVGFWWKPWEGRLEENHRKSRKLQFWWNFDVNMM